MSKIIEVTDTIVSIGMDDGSIKEVRLSDCNFIPNIGDEVEVFSSEFKTIVQKKPIKEENTINKSGININVNNVQNTPQKVSVNNGKVVNKLAYCLLALFLGGIGGHQFYAGKIVSGVFYLLFCWTGIPAIIALIDLIIALCKHADSAGNIIV